MSDVHVTEQASKFTGTDYIAGAPGSSLLPNPKNYSYWSDKLNQRVYTLAEGMISGGLWSGMYSNYFKLQAEAEEGRQIASTMEISDSDRSEEIGYIALRPVSVEQWVSVTAFRPLDFEMFEMEKKRTWDGIIRTKKKREVEDAAIETSLQSVYEAYFANLGVADDIKKAKERISLINWEDQKDIAEYKGILMSMFDMTYPEIQVARENFDWNGFPIWAQVKLSAIMLNNMRFQIGKYLTSKKNASVVRLLDRIAPDAGKHHLEQFDDLMEFRSDFMIAFQNRRVADEVVLACERNRLKTRELEAIEHATDPDVSDAKYLASCATEYVERIANARAKK